MVFVNLMSRHRRYTKCEVRVPASDMWPNKKRACSIARPPTYMLSTTLPIWPGDIRDILRVTLNGDALKNLLTLYKTYLWMSNGLPTVTPCTPRSGCVTRRVVHHGDAHTEPRHMWSASGSLANHSECVASEERLFKGN